MFLRLFFVLFMGLSGCHSLWNISRNASNSHDEVFKVKNINGSEPQIFHCRDINTSLNGSCSVKGNGDYLLILGDILIPSGVYKGGDLLISPAGIIESVGCNDIDYLNYLKPTIM